MERGNWDSGQKGQHFGCLIQIAIGFGSVVRKGRRRSQNRESDSQFSSLSSESIFHSEDLDFLLFLVTQRARFGSSAARLIGSFCSIPIKLNS